MPLRVCSVCGKEDNLVGYVRSSKCKSCSSYKKRPWRLKETLKGSGYRMIMVDGNRVYEHRYNAEILLGRNLLPTECVHHKDHDKLNNSLDNLEVVSSHVEHMKHHIIPRNSDTGRFIKEGN